MISIEVVRDKTSAVATLRERNSSAPSVVSRLSSWVFRTVEYGVAIVEPGTDNTGCKCLSNVLWQQWRI